MACAAWSSLRRKTMSGRRSLTSSTLDAGRGGKAGLPVDGGKAGGREVEAPYPSAHGAFASDGWGGSMAGAGVTRNRLLDRFELVLLLVLATIAVQGLVDTTGS